MMDTPPKSTIAKILVVTTSILVLLTTFAFTLDNILFSEIMITNIPKS